MHWIGMESEKMHIILLLSGIGFKNGYINSMQRVLAILCNKDLNLWAAIVTLIKFCTHYCNRL